MVAAPVAAPVVAAPIIAPDLSAATINPAVTEVTTVTAPLLPAKIRARIYEIGTPVGVIASAVAPVVGGSIGAGLIIFGAAVLAGVGVLARVNVQK